MKSSAYNNRQFILFSISTLIHQLLPSIFLFLDRIVITKFMSLFVWGSYWIILQLAAPIGFLVEGFSNTITPKILSVSCTKSNHETAKIRRKIQLYLPIYGIAAAILSHILPYHYVKFIDHFVSFSLPWEILPFVVFNAFLTLPYVLFSSVVVSSDRRIVVPVTTAIACVFQVVGFY